MNPRKSFRVSARPDASLGPIPTPAEITSLGAHGKKKEAQRPPESTASNTENLPGRPADRTSSAPLREDRG